MTKGLRSLSHGKQYATALYSRTWASEGHRFGHAVRKGRGEDGQGQEAMMPSSSVAWLTQKGLIHQLFLTSKEQ